MTNQTDRLIAEVQSKNKAENYHKENTINCKHFKIYGKIQINLIILATT